MDARRNKRRRWQRRVCDASTASPIHSLPIPFSGREQIGKMGFTRVGKGPQLTGTKGDGGTAKRWVLKLDVDHSSGGSVATAKEIEALKRKLKREAEKDQVERTRQARLSRYAAKSNAGARKGNRSKASRRDIFSKGGRLPGSGFSRRG